MSGFGDTVRFKVDKAKKSVVFMSVVVSSSAVLGLVAMLYGFGTSWADERYVQHEQMQTKLDAVTNQIKYDRLTERIETLYIFRQVRQLTREEEAELQLLTDRRSSVISGD